MTKFCAVIRDFPSKRISRQTTEKLLRKACAPAMERLESRLLLSSANAIDEIDFGNPASESVHQFDPGFSSVPIAGVGEYGLTYREPFGSGNGSTTSSQDLTFTMDVDPNLQNYLTVKLWGSDVDGGVMAFINNPNIPQMDYSAGPPEYPNQFFYETAPIPISMTQGKTSVQMTLMFFQVYDAYADQTQTYLSNGQMTRPVYAAYTTTDPQFVPASTALVGSMPPTTGMATNTALTLNQAVSILEANRESIFGSGGYLSTVLAEQALVLSSAASGPNNTYIWTAPSGAPEEVTGLDLFTNVASWTAANPSATAAQWDQQIAGTQAGPGYTAFPDELISVLAAAYETAPFTNAGGTVVSGLDDYHDPTLIARIVAAIDGASYEQDSDGGFIQQGDSAAANSAWTGLTSEPRTLGAYAGATFRQSTVHGGGDLQGVDTYTLGWTIIELLNDPTAAPILESYLTQSYDANLTNEGYNTGQAASVERVTAWEEMLYNAINFYEGHTGGVESQNSFQMTALYADQVALEKLQALYPNSLYPALAPDTGLNYVEQLMGFAPDTLRGIATGTSAVNYGETDDGMGEAHGVLSSGYDGRYGEMLSWLDPDIAYLTQLDPGLTSASDKTMISEIVTRADAAINSYDEFISPQQNYNGADDVFTMAQEDFITYRDPYNPNVNAGSFHLNSQYIASAAGTGVDDAYALRSAYLETQYNVTPGYNNSNYNSSLNYLKDLDFYESTIRGLVGVNPSSLTPLPGEPGQPNSEFVDPQSGAVAVYYNGERLYINANYRNYETNGSSFVDMGPSYLARIDDTLNNIEYAATIMMPHDATTVQSDGNLSSSQLQSEWVVRYGNWLIVGNPSGSAVTVTLPPGVGVAEDHTTATYYDFGASLSVAAGGSAVIRLNVPNPYAAVGPGIDVGSVGFTGDDTYANGVYTVTGSGAGIGGTLDAFHFVPTSYSGSSSIIAEIASQTAANSSSQAGVMIRDGAGANAAFAEVVRTTGNGVMFEWRSAAGDAAQWVTVPDPLTGVWVQVSRNGNNVSGFYSTDGIHWTQIGATQALTFQSSPTSAEYGLAVTSATNSSTSTAIFTNVTVGATPSVIDPAAASATVTAGTSVNLSVLGSDSNDTYTWVLIGAAPDAVSYSADGTNAAQNTIATFSVAGVYTFQATITNSSCLSTLSNSVTVAVQQKLSGVTVATQSSGASTLVIEGTSLPLVATAVDQFGELMETSQTYSWAIASGVGSVTSLGVYSVPASTSGAATVSASVGGFAGTINLTIPASLGIFSANQDIGFPSPAGSASFNSATSTYTVSGSGSDVWGTSDQLQYVYESLTGGGAITAYVSSVTDTNEWTKVGIMFRDSLSADGAYAFLMLTPTTTEGAAFQYRSGDGASAAQNFQATGSGNDAPGWIRLVWAGNTFTAYQSTNGTTWTVSGTPQTIDMGPTLYVGLAVCSHDAGSLATAAFTNVSVSPATRTFAANEDIGQPSPLGSYSESGGAVTLTAGGADIWSTSDQFQYGYNEVTGSGSLTLEVNSITDTNASTKAGIMLRNTLAANSANVSIFVTPSDGIEFQWRTSAGASTSQSAVTGLAAPYWIRLTDTSNGFTAYYSANGTTWTQVGSAETVAMNSELFAGIALTSHDSGTLATAVFNNITSTFMSATIPPPTLSKAAAASVNPVTGKTVVLSAAGTDSVEGSANLIYTWSALGEPPAAMTFSGNGTNAGASTTVTFTAAGVYLFQVAVGDPNGFQTTSTVSVTANQTLTSITLSPAASSVGPNSTYQFSALALDQFGNPMASPPTFVWSLISGSGGINSSTGVFTSPSASGSASVQATSGGINGTTTVTTVNQPPLVANSGGAAASNLTSNSVNLGVSAVDDGGAANLSYNWTCTGPAAVTYTGATNGANAASNITANFTASGTYNFTVTVTDAGGLSTTSGVSVVVAPTFATQSGSALNISLSGSGPVTLGSSAGNIAAAQNGTQLTFSGVTSIVVTDSGSGDTLNFSGPLTVPLTFSNTSSSIVNVNSGTMTLAAVPGGSINLGTLSIASNSEAVLAAATTPQPTTLNLNNLTIASTGQFDVTNNIVFINYGSGTDPISTIAGYLSTGYDFGLWKGDGIISSNAAANSGSYGVGYADSADAGNPAGLPTGTIKIMYTPLGDADLNGVVNGTDFGILAANFNKGVSRWDEGDFNYAGVVNGTDFGELTANFNQGANILAGMTVSAPATNTNIATTVSIAASAAAATTNPAPTAKHLVNPKPKWKR